MIFIYPYAVKGGKNDKNISRFIGLIGSIGYNACWLHRPRCGATLNRHRRSDRDGSDRIKPLSNPNSFTVLEQNYEYDLLSPRKLLDKYVSKELKLITRNPYTDKEEIVTATLLSNNEGTPVYKIGNEITFNHPGRLIFPEVPESLISKPTLLWLLDSKTSSSQKIEALYLTSGINWRADYILVLNDKDTSSNVFGWVQYPLMCR